MAKGSIPAPPVWLSDIFSAATVGNGGVVRRAVSDVRKHGGGLKRLKAEVKRRGFHLIRTGDQYVILCHKGDLRMVC